MPERETISPADAARVRAIIDDLGLNSSTARYLGVTHRNLPRIERMAEGRAKLTPWERDTIRLIAREREHIAMLQQRNRERPRAERLRDHERDRAILGWLRTGKAKGEDQDPRARKQAIRALAALGYDPDKKMPYKRTRRRR